MARKPKLSWYASKQAYMATVHGVRYNFGTDERAARLAFAALLRRYELGTEPPCDTIPFADCADQYISAVKGKLSDGRWKQTCKTLEDFARFIGEATRVKDVKAARVEDWLTGRDLMEGSRTSYKAIVLACLNWAARPVSKGGGGLIGANPLKGKLSLPAGGSRGGETVWTDATFQQVLSVASVAFADLVRILRWTGCRPSLACRIEARHYNPRTGTWDCADLSRGKKACRRVWLPAPARELVERLNGLHPTGPIFLNTKGRPWTRTNFCQYLRKLRRNFAKSRGLEWQPGLCLYGLRHTFATEFIREHPDKLEYLREIMGHKDLKMIRKHYGHLFDEHSAIHGTLDKLFP